jgi:hypothetical protein
LIRKIFSSKVANKVTKRMEINKVADVIKVIVVGAIVEMVIGIIKEIVVKVAVNKIEESA